MRRRRVCRNCGWRETTHERYEGPDIPCVEFWDASRVYQGLVRDREHVVLPIQVAQPAVAAEPAPKTIFRNRQPWTDAELETLQKALEDGASITEAGRLVGRSRSATANRMALLGMKSKVPLGDQSRRSALPRRAEPPARSKPARPRSKNPCQWIVGEYADDDSHFCGAPAVEGRLYCPEHLRRAHTARHDDEEPEEEEKYA